VDRRICYEINSSSDERPRCVLYFLLICDLQDASDGLWDSLSLINTHASASRVVHLRLLDSSVDRFIKIRASGVAGDLDGGSLIGWVRQRRFTMRSLSMMTDRRLMRWITMNVTTNCCLLVWFGTDEFYSINSIELNDNCYNSKLNTHRLHKIMQYEAIMTALITSESY
jgi:hypothetical protein